MEIGHWRPRFSLNSNLGCRNSFKKHLASRSGTGISYQKVVISFRRDQFLLQIGQKTGLVSETIHELHGTPTKGRNVIQRPSFTLGFSEGLIKNMLSLIAQPTLVLLLALFYKQNALSSAHSPSPVNGRNVKNQILVLRPYGLSTQGMSQCKQSFQEQDDLDNLLERRRNGDESPAWVISRPGILNFRILSARHPLPLASLRSSNMLCVTNGDDEVHNFGKAQPKHFLSSSNRFC